MNNMRNRPQQGTPTQQRARPAVVPQKTIGFSGNQGIAENQRNQDIARAERERRYAEPLRFWMNPGEQKRVVILDYTVEKEGQYPGLFYMHEHEFKNPRTGKWGEHELCCAGVGDCPVCNGSVTGTPEKAYYAMYLSVIDLTPYTKDGKRVPHSYKMLMVKGGQIDAFLTVFANSGAGNRLRGMKLILGRENVERSPKSGVPIPFNNRVVQGFFSEQELTQRFGHPEKKNAAGAVYKKANADIIPFDYRAHWVATESGSYEVDICNRWGVTPPTTNRHGGFNDGFTEDTFGDDSFGSDGFGEGFTDTTDTATNGGFTDDGFGGDGFGGDGFSEQVTPPPVTTQRTRPAQGTPQPTRPVAPTNPPAATGGDGFDDDGFDGFDDNLDDGDIPF